MILVAVSGGIDSMCLAEKVRLEGGPFAIAHCNFGLRGAESDADESFVRSWAASHGVTCHVKHFQTADWASENKISIEMAARQLRYHWFGELCREFGYSSVAVAHNANDNAETLILNLLRGTGLRGITGMKPSGFIPDPEFCDIPLLRPILDMTREEIVAFATEHGLSWREDGTNSQNDYKRNKIRNLVFPVFKEINPSFVETLNKDMARFSDETEALSGRGRFLEGGPRPANVPCSAIGTIIDGPGGANEMRPRPQEYIQVVYSITEEPWDGTKPVKQPEGELILDADKFDGEAVLGTWEQGDWIRPLGAPGRKKIQDWFTDHHISMEEKHAAILLRSAGEHNHILAIAGHCIDHSVRVTSSTRRILRILREE